METPSNDPRGPKQHERHHLPIGQIKQLLEEAQEPALKTFLTMAITTGMRKGELLALRWQDIDMQNEILYVRRIVSGNEDREATETARTIALPTIVLRALKEQQQQQEQERAQRGESWQDRGLVLADASGQYYPSRKLWQQSHAVFVAVGLPRLHFHDLRYNTVVLLIEMGVAVPVIRAILGFRSQNTTLKTLTPVSLSMQEEAMKRWDRLLETER